MTQVLTDSVMCARYHCLCVYIYTVLDALVYANFLVYAERRKERSSMRIQNIII